MFVCLRTDGQRRGVDADASNNRPHMFCDVNARSFEEEDEEDEDEDEDEDGKLSGTSLLTTIHFPLIYT